MSSPRACKRNSQRAIANAILLAVSLTLCAAWFRSPVLNNSWQPLGVASTLEPTAQWRVPPPLPWKPLLNAAQLRRGLSFYGSGARIERVATKLLAGLPITAVTIGGSVTRGAGASTDAMNYPNRFFEFIRTTFPHRDHVLLNKGIGGTTSGVFLVCAEVLVPPETDLVVVEFTFNENADLSYTTPSRRGFEQLLRKLLRLPNSPAVIMLHHYAWYFSYGDGVDAGLFYRQAEEQLGTMAQYYDMPAPSVRNALYFQMHADEEPFRVSRVHKGGTRDSQEATIRVAGPHIKHRYYYYDSIHPSDSGHQAMAELLAGVVLTAVQSVAAPQAGRDATHGTEPVLSAAEMLAATSNASLELPPPMIPGNLENPTTLCAMQEDFKPMAHKLQGFDYKPEKPDRKTFVEQKWGYTGERSGAWMELLVSTEESPGAKGEATVHLGYLKSYANMAVAMAECKSGCRCSRTLMDGLWATKVSLMQMHSFKATQHPKCVIRVTIIERSYDTPGGLSPPGSGYKFQVNAVMVAHTPLVLTYLKQAEDLATTVSGGL